MGGGERTSEHQSEEYTCSLWATLMMSSPASFHLLGRVQCPPQGILAWRCETMNRPGNIYLTYGCPTHCCLANLAHSLTIPCWFLSQHKSCVTKKTGSSCSLWSGSILPLCGTLSEAAQITHSECFVGVVAWADDLADSQLISWVFTDTAATLRGNKNNIPVPCAIILITTVF